MKRVMAPVQRMTDFARYSPRLPTSFLTGPEKSQALMVSLTRSQPNFMHCSLMGAMSSWPLMPWMLGWPG